MKFFKISSFICFILALTILTSCTTNDPSLGTESSSVSDTQQITESQKDTESETEPQKASFTFSVNTKIIRPEDTDSEDMISSISLLRKAGTAFFGKAPDASDDWYRGELVRNEFEILLGNTNRPESQIAYDSLTYYDYTYEVISPNSVVICGGSDSATLAATEKFLLDCYGYISDNVGSGTLKELEVGTSYTYKHEYTLSSLTLCGKEISEYTIVHLDKKSYLTAAKKLQKEIEKVSGKKLSIASVNEFSGKDAILLGCAALDSSHIYSSYGQYNYLVKSEIVDGATRVIIDATTNISSILNAFIQEFLSSVPEKGSYNINISEKETILYTCLKEMNGLVFVGKTDELITDGVVYSKITYKDKNGKPIIAYAIEADLSKVSVLNATPNYGNTIYNVSATTKQAMQAVKNAGFEVFAGVNADFFRMSTDYSPQGLCIKNGVMLSDANARPWFGITNDGLPVIGSGDQYSSKYEGQIKEAVGGSQIILKNGLFYDIAYGSEFGYTRHPRTAVGTTADGKLILLVVDGRQPSISNGASLGDLAKIFLDLGVTNAINLDGGGSSTLITSSSPDEYITRNSPSDGWLRHVYNSLVIVKK